MDSTKATTSNMTGKAPSVNPKNPYGSNPKKTNAPKPPNPKVNVALPPHDAQNDPDSMFKGGFLADVYSENPVRSDGMGRVVTRFPPEPNGFLHLGHTKAIMINFGFARFHGGDCYLRFDDTNPTGEEEKYFVAIEEMINWLGFKPVKVTHSSDNFDRLYELAEDLINKNGAYVCHCTKEEVVAQRGGGKGKARYACPHRDRPNSESLTEFRAMRDGKYAPREAVLRMKQNLEDNNPQMWDLTAYRVLDEKHKHHRTGNKWRIYPTYDFTHCLCDSFEGVTHSLCTTEFELSRVSYGWLCDKVAVYKPMQREFGRLRISGTVLSKRKILALIENNHAILSFVNELGVTKAETTIDTKRFEQCIRRYLEVTVPRLMLVLDPIPVVIDNIPEDYIEMVELPLSKDPASGVHTVPFTRTVYIERSDFRESASKDFFRLAPGTSVGLLKVPYPITATRFETDPETGVVTLVHARYEKPDEGTTFKKPKRYLHPLGCKMPFKEQPRQSYSPGLQPLFKSDDPNTRPDGFLSDVNPRSEEIFPNAMIETGIEEIKRTAPWPRPREGHNEAAPGITPPETVRFQGMRVAYFCLDRDSSEANLVLNRIRMVKGEADRVMGREVVNIAPAVGVRFQIVRRLPALKRVWSKLKYTSKDFVVIPSGWRAKAQT
ncbi:hypothetical protein VE00_04859 [Pseudogymnoascus sp. WSF 3629]|nr:hypothetical protein VE00_04859 [Pseudogymnoascus sp. WSF 3629]